jgi:dTDP-4-dehydrorhamnose reductase
MPELEKSILMTGSTGLVGTRYKELFGNENVTTMGRSNCDLLVDLLAFPEVERAIEESGAEVVLHLAAATNVDQAQSQMGDTEGDVYMLNTRVPEFIAEVCQRTGRTMVLASTGFVFRGDQENKPYNEDDEPSPVASWYAITKHLAEENVQERMDGDNLLIVRFAFPFSSNYERKSDMARTIIKVLSDGNIFRATDDQKVQPTYTEDIVNGLHFLIEADLSGTYHLATQYENDYITPYDFARALSEARNLDTTLVHAISFAELSQGYTSPRPQHSWLDTSKVTSAGFTFMSFDQILVELNK